MHKAGPRRLPLPPAAPLPGRWERMRASLVSVASELNRNWLTRVGVGFSFAFIGLVLIGPIFAGNPQEQTEKILEGPTAAHWLGTDHLGRDLLARTLEGGQVSLFVAIASVVLGLLIAVPIGLVAGFFGGGWVDEMLMGGIDVILSLPLFVLGLFVLGLTGTGGSHVGPIYLSGAWKVILLIAVAASPFFSRVARAATLVEVREDYVDAMRVSGVSRPKIVTREILINVLPPVMVQAFLWIAIAIFAEAALSFLGLGVQPPYPTLGNILSDANNYLLLGSWWYSLFPGLILVIAIVGFNLVGDGLSELLDPQVRV